MEIVRQYLAKKIKKYKKLLKVTKKLELDSSNSGQLSREEFEKMVTKLSKGKISKDLSILTWTAVQASSAEKFERLPLTQLGLWLGFSVPEGKKPNSEEVKNLIKEDIKEATNQIAADVPGKDRERSANAKPAAVDKKDVERVLDQPDANKKRKKRRRRSSRSKESSPNVRTYDSRRSII